MANFDIRQTTTTGLKTGVPNFSIDATQVSGIQDAPETKQTFEEFNNRFTYYDTIPELKKAIQVYATWVLGQGYDSPQSVILDNITGSGEDSFTSILWNLLVTKKINGDAFAEIVRNDKGTLINLKPLNPQRMAVIFSKKGVIDRYEYQGRKEPFTPDKIFHLVNDRIADSTHGDSVIDALKWLIDARQEAMRDWRRISHRSTIRVLIVDEDDPAKLTTLKTQYKDAIKNGEVLILPGKPGEKAFQDLQLPPVEAFLAWIRYLENAFYKAVGTPKTLAGDAEGIPESGGKMVVLTHEPTYVREVNDLENDIWNQLAIRITFKRQASLKENVREQEGKSINQTQAVQPSDTNIRDIK
ncbi:MAG: phage portal protein [Candidatus Heimdallarchaeaceae archaeon]